MTFMKEVRQTQLRKPDERTIETLEGLLADAKTGDLQSVIFVDKYYDGKVGNGWSGTPNERMLAELLLLQMELSAMILNSRDME